VIQRIGECVTVLIPWGPGTCSGGVWQCG